MRADTRRRVVTIGESMLQITPSPIGRLANATRASLSVAGAESNVASYLSRLGHTVFWLSAVGDDPIGERIVSDIRAAGVRTDLVVRDSTAPSAVYFKDAQLGGATSVHYYRSGSAASRMTGAFLDDFAFSGDDLVHVSGITPALSTGCHELIETTIDRAHRAGARVSFDVNYRPALWEPGIAGPILRALADTADVVFVGLDEAQEIWGTETPASIRDRVPRPDILVVKDGPVRATAFHGGAQTDEPALVVDVIEPVGAGDAFAAGFLHGLLTDAGVPSSLRHGHRLAASALVSTGDVGAMPDGFAGALSPVGESDRIEV
ncbi:sugar kinase [Herbiconiux ginsengi]|uniref:2-dehydro-3-deoxygluconokinase n=1 Tax=Herbiconiux ginsengi TaxID=381665 RepID=A0A1H3LGS5_9MICO|nr:sugar kinase [Herbiconiux ginsengi]SDY63737.1 2-dehydro-3-deoxygluconokinase [Herbiconiux ginsengi]